MTDIDWASGEVAHELVAQLVSPTDHDVVVGELALSSGGCSITEGYYTDTRVSAQLSVQDWSAYDGSAWVRLRHRVRGVGHDELLMTGIVWDEGASLSHGAIGAAPSLVSVLKPLAEDALPFPVAVGAGARASEVALAVCSDALRPARVAPGCPDHVFAETSVWDAGTERLGVLFDLCDLMGSRLEVDADGTVALTAYAPPSSREASAWLDACSAGTVLSAEMSRSSDAHQVPGRSIVTWSGAAKGTGGADAQASGYADVPASSQASPQRRGYVVSEVHQLSDMAEPHTTAHAQQLARGYLDADASGTVEWSARTVWMPVHAGDVVMLRPDAAVGWRKCLVKQVRADLSAWVLDLTLKEV